MKKIIFMIFFSTHAISIFGMNKFAASSLLIGKIRNNRNSLIEIRFQSIKEKDQYIVTINPGQEKILHRSPIGRRGISAIYAVIKIYDNEKNKIADLSYKQKLKKTFIKFRSFIHSKNINKFSVESDFNELHIDLDIKQQVKKSILKYELK